MEIAQRVDQCAKWLKINGFEVQGVERCGRIHIRTSPLCEQLEGAIAGFSRGPRGVQRYKTVIRFDCEVRWIDGGRNEPDTYKEIPLQRMRRTA